MQQSTFYSSTEPKAEILSPVQEQHVRDPLSRVLWLPCRLVVEVPVVGFTVRTLMGLRVGAIVETLAEHNEDLPLLANGQLVGLTEFEVVGDRLAVRLTSMA